MTQVPAKSASRNPAGRAGKYTAARGKQAAAALGQGLGIRKTAELIGVAESTLKDWLRMRPELREMVEDAKEARALITELRTYDRAMKAVDGEMTPAEAKAFDSGSKHVRWLLARLDPARYGERHERRDVVQVVIQTDLDLGQEGLTIDGEDMPTEYRIEAIVPPKLEDKRDG